MPATVAFLNRKGGVGKTSSVYHLGGTLAKRGLKVLLADVDPQASLTQGLLGPDVAEDLDPRETIASIFDESGVSSPRDLVRPTAFENLHLIPGSESADDYNFPKPWECGLSQFVLRDALAEASEGFDIVLIDCPPHVQLWAWSAMVAAQGIVVPLQCEDFGAQGMRSIQMTIARVQAEINPDLRLLGYLLTMFNKSLSVHSTYQAFLRETHGDDVFATTMPLAADFKESVILRKPIVEFKPKSASSKAMAALADELLGRIESRIVNVAGRDAA